jgi:hypothetical protein
MVPRRRAAGNASFCASGRKPSSNRALVGAGSDHCSTAASGESGAPDWGLRPIGQRTLTGNHDWHDFGGSPARASALAEDAHAFQRAAEQEGSHLGAPAALEPLREALQVLSAAWYRIAADTSPHPGDRRPAFRADAGSLARSDGLSREQEVRLMGALHDVAAAFARCARACREAESTVAPVIDQRTNAGGRDEELPWFAGPPPDREPVPR